MKSKLIFSALILSLIICFSFLSLVPKTTAKEKTDLPEEEGIYDVPENPKLKLKVMVYRIKDQSPAKPVKPTPTPIVLPDPICNLADENSSTLPGGLTGWHLKNGTMTYRLNVNNVPFLVGSANFSNIAKNGFDAWVSNSNLNGKISFIQGSNTTVSRATYDGQNIITWGRVSASNAIAIAYTWYNQTTGEVAEVDTIMNQKLPWGWVGSGTNCAYPNYYDAQDILTHELGHWFGLDDAYDSIFSDHTMYGYGSTGEMKKNTPTLGDIFAVNTIY